ncbi:MAG: Fe-S oxidoreductase, partial [Bacteroidota bacterium]
MLSSVLFALILGAGIWFFYTSIRKIIRNINLGRDVQINDRKSERWTTMFRVALGQSKMVTRPVAGFFHIIIYAGFIIINIEVLEIIIDGLFGTHRIFAKPLGPIYDFLIASFEILAFLVVVACVVFFARRAIIR